MKAAVASDRGYDAARRPWSPPPPDATAVMVVGLALWLFPPWAAWIDRHRG